VLESVDIHLAAAFARLSGERDHAVLLAAALASRAPRHGHVCVDLSAVAGTVAVEGTAIDEIDLLTWPDPHAWVRALEQSPLVAPPDADDDDPRPLVLAGHRLYLDRLWRDEQFVAGELLRRAMLDADDWALGRTDVLDDHFGPLDDGDTNLQRHAATTMLTRSLTLLAGGPGTGKTGTIARMLAVLLQPGGTSRRVALAAPTGKAAARMGDAVFQELAGVGVDSALIADVRPTTLHRLLGLGGRRRSTRPIDADIVIIDEFSMVSLPLMAELLRALPDTTRLVLVGDPDQLASVEAGTVLADIVGARALAATDGRAVEHAPGPLADSIVVLRRPYRFDAGSDIKALADAIRTGDLHEVARLLSVGRSVRHIDHDDPLASSSGEGLRPVLVAAGETTFRRAAAGDAGAALGSISDVRLLCGHRRGRHGVDLWNERIEHWLEADVPAFSAVERWYVGRPLLVTRNDAVTRLNNGDLGVVVADGSDRRVALERSGDIVLLRPVQLPDTETVHAMTIHKSQGSEFGQVIVIVPPDGSRLASRELLYTAVTRARNELVVVGTWSAIEASVRRRVSRSSGLRDALWTTDPKRTGLS
jgi:exodeoxyribonuclease V alpha subunit